MTPDLEALRRLAEGVPEDERLYSFDTYGIDAQIFIGRHALVQDMLAELTGDEDEDEDEERRRVHAHAAFIAAANPTVILDLIERVQRAEATLADFAEADCAYGDGCPAFGTRHGRCVGCRAREALAALGKEEG